MGKLAVKETFEDGNVKVCQSPQKLEKVNNRFYPKASGGNEVLLTA